MNRPWHQEDVDRHYTRFTTRIHDEESLGQMVEPIVKRFTAEGFRTAIVTKKPGEDYVIHCIAVRLLKGEIPQIVSKQVSTATSDGIKVASVREAEIEPLGISFGKPRF